MHGKPHKLWAAGRIAEGPGASGSSGDRPWAVEDGLPQCALHGDADRHEPVQHFTASAAPADSGSCQSGSDRK